MCGRLAFSLLIIPMLALANSAGAGVVIMQCDVGGCGPLQSGWIGLGSCGTYTNVGGSGIDVNLATGNAGACDCRDPGGTGTLADVEYDLLFADNQTTSPDSDFIITLSNLTAGVAYRLLSYHNRSDEGDTTIPNVTITGATVISKPASIVQNHDIMDNPAECIFVAGAGDAVIRYQGPDGGCAGCQAFLNGFVLEISGPVIQFDSDSSGALEAVSPAILTVVLSNPEVGQTYTVDYAAIDGTAVNGTDYILAADMLTFDPGVTSQQIEITIVNDGVEENDETIIVELSSPTATGGDVSLGAISQHTYAILDPRTGVAFDAPSSSGLEDVTPAAIAVSLSASVGEVVTVDYAVSGGTAAGGGVDYQLLGTGTLQFDPYELTRYIELAVVDDSIEEVPDETIELTLSNTSSNVKLGIPYEHTYTIIDNEEGVRWDGLTWYYSDYPNPLFVNEDGQLVWYPERPPLIITRLPEYRLSQPGDIAEITYWWMTDGDHDCDDCFSCEDDCYDDDITCIAGTSDFRAGLFDADGEYITEDGFDWENSIFVGYKGYEFRFGPHMPSDRTRFEECGEVHETGNFAKKPPDLDSFLHENEWLDEAPIPGFDLPPGEWSLWTISLERLSSSRVRCSITLNDITHTWTDDDDYAQPQKIDVFGLKMRNGRPYSILELESTSPPPPPPPPGSPEAASDPNPADGANDVDPNVALTWTTGANTVWHDVYFGTDFDNLKNADISSDEHRDRQDFDVNTYEVFGLDLGATYHWRIDEISESDACKGQVWEFTVRDYLIVDNMESYNSHADIQAVWKGRPYPDAYNGGFVYLEQTTVHIGEKSMLFYFDFSEGNYFTAARTYSAEDWIGPGVSHLLLWFYGYSGNLTSDQMYVILKDGSGHSETVTYDGDPGDITEEQWQQWFIDLSLFSDGGVNLVDVREVIIGVDTADNFGMVIFDDIRLYVPKCVPQLGPTADFTGDCFVDFKDFSVFAGQWRESPGSPSADIAPDPPDGFVDGQDLDVLLDNWLNEQLWPQ